MKKHYNRPQTKVVGIMPVGFILVGTIVDKKTGIDELGARKGNVWDEDEEEIEDCMWK